MSHTYVVCVGGSIKYASLSHVDRPHDLDARAGARARVPFCSVQSFGAVWVRLVARARACERFQLVIKPIAQSTNSLLYVVCACACTQRNLTEQIYPVGGGRVADVFVLVALVRSVVATTKFRADMVVMRMQSAQMGGRGLVPHSLHAPSTRKPEGDVHSYCACPHNGG